MVEPYVRKALPGGWIGKDTDLARQPDRQVRHRRSRRRLRPHRPQDHRRHLRRRRPARRRRLLRQGPDQGRPLGRLCRALPRQERGRGRPRRPLHHPALLRHRRRQAAVDLRRHCTAPARSTRAKLETVLGEVMDLSPRGIRKHLDLNKPIYARTSAYGHFGRAPDNGRRLLVGEDRPRPCNRKGGQLTIQPRRLSPAISSSRLKHQKMIRFG